uniref:Uncharacterized protein n=1 Tax=Arundo donax TaxID=35708 RepID=A0A0A9GZM3_ARUDO
MYLNNLKRCWTSFSTHPKEIIAMFLNRLGFVGQPKIHEVVL